MDESEKSLVNQAFTKLVASKKSVIVSRAASIRGSYHKLKLDGCFSLDGVMLVGAWMTKRLEFHFMF